MQVVNTDRKESLIAASEAARLLGVSREWVRQLTAAGRLGVLTVEPNGFRVYFRSEVERLKAEREAKAEAN